MPDAQGVPGRPPSASWHLRGVKLGSEAAGCAMRRERSRSQGGGEEERLQRLVDERQEARRARDYDEADRLRENLRGMGVEVNDSELSWKGPGGLGGLIRNGATMGTTRREGDWDCPNCGSLNFGYRDLCFKCNTQKTQDRGGGGRGDYMGRDDGRDRVDDRRGRYEEDRRGFRDDRYERGPDRYGGDRYDRGGGDRYDPRYDRGMDRGMDRGYDRGYDRVPDRGYDRFDRGGGYDRDRYERFDRGGYDDRRYDDRRDPPPMPPGYGPRDYGRRGDSRGRRGRF